MTNLLKVLDISEDEQQMIWLIKKEVMVGAVLQCKGGGELPCPSESLADLAFRLRDEVCNPKTYTKCCENYYDGLEAVYNHRIKDKQCGSFYGFQTYRIKPIDMIIAALIAKEIQDG